MDATETNSQINKLVQGREEHLRERFIYSWIYVLWSQHDNVEGID